MPKGYPQSLEIGDIVNVKFGYGYCDEIEDNHYAIILSKIVGSMFLIAPLTSNEPKGGRMLFYDDLMLPSKNRTTERSYILFNQIRFAHYRRLENIHIIGRRHIDITRVREILAIFNEIVTL